MTRNLPLIAFFSGVGLYAALLSASAFIVWLKELHYYAQARWNFTVSAPVYKLGPLFRPTSPSNNAVVNVARLVSDWPQTILFHAGWAVISLTVARWMWNGDPRLSQPMSFSQWRVLIAIMFTLMMVPAITRIIVSILTRVPPNS